MSSQKYRSTNKCQKEREARRGDKKGRDKRTEKGRAFNPSNWEADESLYIEDQPNLHNEF